MFILRDQIVVQAPAERCFLLSTSIAVVERELKMHPAAGRTSGFVTGGDTVLWKGWQLGMPQVHQSQIRNFLRNEFFQDAMVKGRFHSFEHDHAFLNRGNGSVLLRDELRFTMPLGWAGWVVGRAVLVPHIRGLMQKRFQLIKTLAEGDGWRQYLEPGELGEEAAAATGHERRAN